MIWVIFVLCTALYLAFVNRMSKAEELAAELRASNARLKSINDLYDRQSRETSDLVVAIAPLIEMTNWTGEKRYGVNYVELEKQRNQTIAQVRGQIMTLPVVQRTPLFPISIPEHLHP